MLPKSILRLSVAVVFMALLASCHKNVTGRLIPKDALVVIVANTKSLASKLSWDEVKQNAALQKILSDSSRPAILRSILNRPDSSGVDIFSDLIIFIKKDSIGGYLCIEGTVKDPALFKNFIQQTANGGSESQDGGITFISHAPSCTGWDNNKFVCILDAPSLGRFNAMHTTNPINRDIAATCKAVFGLDNENSLAKNEKFDKLIKEKGDIHFWINSEAFYTQAATENMSIVNLDDFFKDNITTATLSFDTGKISLTSRSYINDKMLAFYKNYVNGEINEDIIKRMPGQVIDGAFAANFKTTGIKELLKIANIDGAANSAFSRLGITEDDITNAFKGDLFFGISDFNIKIDSSPYTIGKPIYQKANESSTGNFVFAAAIGNKESFNKLLNTAKSIIAITQGPDAINHLPFSFDNNSDYFVIANSKENVAKFLAGESSNKFDFINNIKGAPFGGYINLQPMLKSLTGLINKDSLSQQLYDTTLDMWDNVYMKGGNVEDDVTTGTLEINLIDKSTNSLKMLCEYIAKTSKVMKEQQAIKEAEEEKEYEESLKADTTLNTMPH